MTSSDTPDRIGVGGRIRRSKPLMTIGLLGLGVLVSTLLVVLKPVPEAAPRDVRPTLVSTEPLTITDDALVVQGFGFVTPVQRADIAARVRGAMVAQSDFLFAGKFAAKDTVLARIDPAPYEAALAQAEATLADLKAQAIFVDKQITRSKTLNTKGFAAEERLDDRTSQRDRLAAQIKAQEARVQQVSLDLEHTIIRAPFDGWVAQVHADLGDVVQPGTPLLALHHATRLEVAVTLEDRAAALIPGLWALDSNGAAPQANVAVSFGGTAHTWTGKVTRVGATLDRGTRAIPVIVEVTLPPPGTADQDVRLLPGMYATVSITGKAVGPHALIPRRALHDGPSIWTVGPENQLRIVPVEVLHEVEDKIHISVPPDVLEAAPRPALVISAHDVVTDGMVVRQAGTP